MKRSALIVLLLAVIFMLSLPATSLAEHKKWEGYLSFKGGAYFPTGDLEDYDFDSGFNGEVLLGMYVNKNLALEFGGGYFKTDASFSDATGFWEEDDVWVIPVIVNIKGVLPLKSVELFGGGGIGLYFANIDVEGYDPDPLIGPFSGDDNDAIFGGHLLAGFNIDLSDKVFIGVEGKYIFTANNRFFCEQVSCSEIHCAKINLDGFTLTGGLGFRF
jgi:opacity protein-like surface antigen